MAKKTIKRFKIGDSSNKKISNRLSKEIVLLQQELQREENIKRGRKAKVITFLFASDVFAKRSRT